MSEKIEIAICEVVYQNSGYYDNYSEKLSGVISEWTMVTKEEYEALCNLSMMDNNPKFTVVVKVPIISKTLKTVSDYIKEARDLIEKNRQREIDRKERERINKLSAEKRKQERDLKKIDKLREKLTELEKLKSGGK